MHKVIQNLVCQIYRFLAIEDEGSEYVKALNEVVWAISEDTFTPKQKIHWV